MGFFAQAPNGNSPAGGVEPVTSGGFFSRAPSASTTKTGGFFAQAPPAKPVPEKRSNVGFPSQSVTNVGKFQAPGSFLNKLFSLDKKDLERFKADQDMRRDLSTPGLQSIEGQSRPIEVRKLGPEQPEVISQGTKKPTTRFQDFVSDGLFGNAKDKEALKRDLESETDVPLLTQMRVGGFAEFFGREDEELVSIREQDLLNKGVDAGRAADIAFYSVYANKTGINNTQKAKEAEEQLDKLNLTNKEKNTLRIAGAQQKLGQGLEALDLVTLGTVQGVKLTVKNVAKRIFSKTPTNTFKASEEISKVFPKKSFEDIKRIVDTADNMKQQGKNQDFIEKFITKEVENIPDEVVTKTDASTTKPITAKQAARNQEDKLLDDLNETKGNLETTPRGDRKLDFDQVEEIDGLITKLTTGSRKLTPEEFRVGSEIVERGKAAVKFDARTIPGLRTTTRASIRQTLGEKRFAETFPEGDLAERLIAEMQSRTRGVISNAETFKASRKLGYDEDRVLNLQLGKALNAEEATAVRGVVEQARQNLVKLIDELADMPSTSSPSDIQRQREIIGKQRVKVFKLGAIERGIDAEAGRALQAAKISVSKLDGEQKWLEKMLASDKTPSDIKDYILKRIADFDGSANEMVDLLRSLHQGSLTEMMVEFATAAKLWMIPTHVVNTISSITRMVLNIPLRGLSAGFDTFISKLPGKTRERFLTDAKNELIGQIAGWRHAGPDAMQALMDENYAFEVRKLQDFNPKGPAIKGRPGKDTAADRALDRFGKAVRVPFRLLGVEDTLIRKPAEQGALYTIIGRAAIKKGYKPGTKAYNDYFADAIHNPTLKQFEEIQHKADTDLFQEDLGKFGKSLEKLRNDYPSSKFVVPFFRTIVNLQRQAIEFSPLALGTPSFRKALKAGDGTVSDALAKMTLGTGAMIPMVHYALEGNVTGAAPLNPSERDKFYAEGKQPYSINFGDKWIPYSRFSPYADLLTWSAMMANAVENDDEKTQSELAAELFFNITQNFFDKSFATGLHDLLGALNNPERGEKWLQNITTGALIPNFIPGFARSIDPTIRETNSIKDAFQSKIPWASRGLPARTDVFGEDLVRPGGAVTRFLSPIVPSKVTVDTVRQELDFIGVDIGFPGQTAGGVKMDDQTYKIFKDVSGKLIYKGLDTVMKTPEYQNANARQKELIVNSVVRQVREAVKGKVAVENLIIAEIKNELKNRGMSSSQAEDAAEKVYEQLKKQEQEQ